MVKHPATQPRYAMMKAGYPKMKAVLTAATMSNPTSYHVSVIQEVKISTNTAMCTVTHRALTRSNSSSFKMKQQQDYRNQRSCNDRLISSTSQVDQCDAVFWRYVLMDEMQCWCVSKFCEVVDQLLGVSSVDTGFGHNHGGECSRCNYRTISASLSKFEEKFERGRLT